MYILEIDNLTKKYGGECANDGISMKIEKGAIYGLLGKNGAGKTTLMKQICGLASNNSGTIIWNEGGARPSIGLAMDTEKFDGNKTAFALLKDFSRYVGDMSDSEIKDILQLVDLDEPRKKVKNYSLGMKKRLSIAIALLNHPDFIILDEPVNGLDPIGIKQIREMIKDINQKSNTTFLVSSHILSELLKISTHVGVIYKGRMIAELDAASMNRLSDEEQENLLLKYMEGRAE